MTSLTLAQVGFYFLAGAAENPGNDWASDERCCEKNLT